LNQRIVLKTKIKILIQKIEKYKQELHEDYILIETILSLLNYLLSENISDEEIKKLLKNTNNTMKIIEEKINKIERSL